MWGSSIARPALKSRGTSRNTFSVLSRNRCSPRHFCNTLAACRLAPEGCVSCSRLCVRQGGMPKGPELRCWSVRAISSSSFVTLVAVSVLRVADQRSEGAKKHRLQKGFRSSNSSSCHTPLAFVPLCNHQRVFIRVSSNRPRTLTV